MGFTIGKREQWRSGLAIIAAGILVCLVFPNSGTLATLVIIAATILVFEFASWNWLRAPFYFLARLFWSFIALIALAWWLGGEKMKRRSSEEITTAAAERIQYRRADSRQ